MVVEMRGKPGNDKCKVFRHSNSAPISKHRCGYRGRVSLRVPAKPFFRPPYGHAVNRPIRMTNYHYQRVNSVFLEAIEVSGSPATHADDVNAG